MHFLLSLRSPALGICKFLIQKIHFFLKSLWFLILKCYVRHIWCSFGIKLIQIHMICHSVSNFENRQSANESFIPTMVQKRGLDPQHWQEFFFYVINLGHRSFQIHKGKRYSFYERTGPQTQQKISIGISPSSYCILNV